MPTCPALPSHLALRLDFGDRDHLQLLLSTTTMPLFFAYCPDRVGDDVLATRLRVRGEHFQGFKQTVQEGHAGACASASRCARFRFRSAQPPHYRQLQ